MVELSAYDKITRAKVQLYNTKPFFSHLTMNMKCIETDEVPSMGVDMRGHLYYNPKWVDKLSEKECEGVLVHEVLHIVLQHLLRCGGREGELFNCSNDLIVNDILVTENMALPEGLVPTYEHKFVMPEFNYTIENINDKSSEQLYDELYKLLKKKGKGGGSGKSGKGKGDGTGGLSKKRFDEHRYADKGNGEGKDKKKGSGSKLSKDDINKLEKVWKERLANAATYARQRGLLPAGMERFIDDILEGKVEWRHKLYKYITNQLPFDFTYARPSKKSIVTGIYMPSVLKEKIEMVVAVDTSGSIQQKELSEFLSEVCHIAKSFVNISMDLLVCDASIQNEYKISNGNIGTIMGLKVGGGGGTSHKPIVDWINDKKPNAKVLISLTDGYSDIEQVFSELPDSCDRLIVLCQNGIDEKQMEPYGETIKLR